MMWKLFVSIENLKFVSISPCRKLPKNYLSMILVSESYYKSKVGTG